MSKTTLIEAFARNINHSNNDTTLNESIIKESICNLSPGEFDIFYANIDKIISKINSAGHFTVEWAHNKLLFTNEKYINFASNIYAEPGVKSCLNWHINLRSDLGNLLLSDNVPVFKVYDAINEAYRLIKDLNEDLDDLNYLIRECIWDLQVSEGDWEIQNPED